MQSKVLFIIVEGSKRRLFIQVLFLQWRTQKLKFSRKHARSSNTFGQKKPKISCVINRNSNCR